MSTFNADLLASIAKANALFTHSATVHGGSSAKTALVRDPVPPSHPAHPKDNRRVLSPLTDDEGDPVEYCPWTTQPSDAEEDRDVLASAVKEQISVASSTVDAPPAKKAKATVQKPTVPWRDSSLQVPLPKPKGPPEALSPQQSPPFKGKAIAKAAVPEVAETKAEAKAKASQQRTATKTTPPKPKASVPQPMPEPKPASVVAVPRPRPEAKIAKVPVPSPATVPAPAPATVPAPAAPLPPNVLKIPDLNEPELDDDLRRSRPDLTRDQRDYMRTSEKLAKAMGVSVTPPPMAMSMAINAPTPSAEDADDYGSGDYAPKSFGPTIVRKNGKKAREGGDPIKKAQRDAMFGPPRMRDAAKAYLRAHGVEPEDPRKWVKERKY